MILLNCRFKPLKTAEVTFESGSPVTMETCTTGVVQGGTNGMLFMCTGIKDDIKENELFLAARNLNEVVNNRLDTIDSYTIPLLGILDS